MRLSVCIPVYGVAPYVETCARSLFAQTYRDIEFLFVDDATPDDSIAIVERVLKDCPDRAGQVKILRHGRNRGLVAARRTALAAATGELLAHCDSDDWLAADFYEKLVAKLDETGADIAMGSTVGEFPDGRSARRDLDERILTGAEAMRAIGALPCVQSIWNKVYRRSLAGSFPLEYPESIRVAEDVCYVMQHFAHARSVALVPRADYHYRIRRESMANATKAASLVRDHVAVYEILSRVLPEADGLPSRLALLRTVLYWGLAHGGLTVPEFRRWRDEYARLGGRYEFPGACDWGRRALAVARFSPRLGALLARLAGARIADML